VNNSFKTKSITFFMLAILFASFAFPTIIRASYQPGTNVWSSPSGINTPPFFSGFVFHFSNPMDESSFSILDDIISFTGPNGAIPIKSTTWIDQSTLSVACGFTQGLGLYTMIIGPRILDTNGEQMDINQNGIKGEIPGDQYIARLYIDNPSIYFVNSQHFVQTNSVASLTVLLEYPILAINVPGKDVSFSSTPAGLSLPPSGTTDQNGLLTIDVISAIPGTYSVFATTTGPSGYLTEQWTLTVYDPIATTLNFVSSPSSAYIKLPVTFTVEVKDQHVLPMKNVRINLWSNPGGLSLPQMGVTDSNGLLTFSAVSPVPNSYTISAQIDSGGLQPVLRVLIVKPPQVSFLASSVPMMQVNSLASISVRTTDNLNRPIGNTVVSFSCSPGGLSLPSSGTTDANGYLTISATSGTSGVYNIQASAGGASAQWILTAYVTIASISFDSGSDTTTTAYVPAQLKVRVVDQYGFPMKNTVVDFSSNPEGLSLPSSGTTDANGYLTIAATSGTAGTYSIQATVGGAITQWILTIEQPNLLFEDESQTFVRVDTAAHIAVRATDKNSRPIGNAVVVFSCSPGGLSLPSSGVTDVNGYLAINAISGITGTYTIQATAGGVSSQWILTVYDPVPAISFDGGSTSAVVAAFVPAILTARVVDQYGYPIEDTVVSFSCSPGGLSLPSSGTTDANGYLAVSASSEITGTYIINAAITGDVAEWILTIESPTVLFDGNSESMACIYSPASLTIRVTYQNGNPIQNARMTFYSSPDGLSLPSTGTTNSEGLVTVDACSKSAGVYTVEATVAGSTAQFNIEIYDPSWRDELNYNSQQQMIDSSWQLEWSEGCAAEVGGGFLTLTNQYGAWNSYARYYFNDDQISNFQSCRIETKAMMLDAIPNADPISDPLDASVGPALFFETQNHWYIWAINYFEHSFMLFQDGELVRESSGCYVNLNEWFTLTVENRGNVLNLYFNNQLEDSFTDYSVTNCEVANIALLSNWAVVKYDYIQLTPDYQLHRPIIIDGDSQFTLANGVTSGTGTESDPYLIENWIIDASITDYTTWGSGITILNANSHFVIKNCELINGIGANEYPTGITIYNSNKGKITNSSIDNLANGVFIGGSNVTIENSVISNNLWGISVSAVSGIYSHNQVDVHFCNIFGNNLSGLSSFNMTQVNAANNWWGAIDGPSSLYSWFGVPASGSGDKIGIPLDAFEPWLTAPVTGAESQVGTDETLQFQNSGVAADIAGSAEVYVATYDSDPTGGLSNNIDKFFDVYVPDSSVLTEMTVKVDYSLPLPNDLSEDSLILYWYSGTAFIPCSDTGVNTIDKYIWARIDANTVPSINDLDGTIFVLSVPDTSSPTTSLVISGPNYDSSIGTYVNANTIFTFSASDGQGSGVASTYYRIHKVGYYTDWVLYTGSFGVEGLNDGNYNIDYRSVDCVGNEECAKTVNVILDKLPPITLLTIGSPKLTNEAIYVTPSTPFTLQSNDNSGSNIASISYKIYSSTYESGWLTYSAPFSLSNVVDGSYILEFKSIDNIGNTEAVQTETVIVGSPNVKVKDVSAGAISSDGSNQTILVNLSNAGYFTETLHLTVYANTQLIYTKNIELAGKASQVESFLWDRAKFDLCTYSIKAIVSQVPGETNTGDNTNQIQVLNDYVQTTYDVIFTQKGLPIDTTWSMTLDGSTKVSTTSTITFSGILLGSHAWIASNPISGTTGTRYIVSTSTGTINVPTQTTLTIAYTTQYQVIFAANNMSAGIINPSITKYYDSGSKVSITATPNSGYAFWAWVSNPTSAITFDINPQATTTTTINGPGTIIATFAYIVNGNRNIAVTGTENILLITSGNNIIDCTKTTTTTIIKTGSGNNIIKFGNGDNIFKATATGNDIITTGDGNNNINIVGAGSNQITTGSGNDQIQITGNGNNIINAGSGNNIVKVSGTGNNQITAGSGNDVITVGGGSNIINAGDGNNQVSAGNGNNQITTGSASDAVVVGNGNNNVKTGAGDDAITAGKGNNVIDGGAGYDTCLHGTGNNIILNCEKK
jgi:hypothetical protein